MPRWIAQGTGHVYPSSFECYRRSMRLRRSLVIACALSLSSWLAAPISAAQQGKSKSGDSAAAQVLWDEARELIKQGDYDAACPKFAESNRLDPQLGTLMNVANCYAEAGKNASAWARFVEAAELAAQRGDPRGKEARKRADELEPKLAKLVIEVAAPADGLEVKRGTETVRSAVWGSELPVDAGEYLIEASAPGRLSFTKQIIVEDGGELRVEIPELELAPDDGDGGSGSGDSGDGSTGMLVAGIVVGAVGLAGVGVGAAFAVLAKSDDDASLDFCLPDDPTQCDAQGVALREDAREKQTISIVGFVAGGALTAAGLVLIATSQLGGDDTPEADDEARVELLPVFGPDGGQLWLRGRF
jgi:hypothetical protein